MLGDKGWLPGVQQPVETMTADKKVSFLTDKKAKLPSGETKEEI